MRINPPALTALRSRTGFTISQFARVLAITPSHLSNIEAGRRQASPSVIVAMAKELDVPLTAITLHSEAVPAA